MSDQVDPNDIRENGSEIEQDKERTLQRVLDDYSQKWKGMIGEAIQNSYDGWIANKYETDVIPNNHNLEIYFRVNMAAREVIIEDNAGGMSEKIFYDNFAGLDTPSEFKKGGESAGSYGRGVHVIVQQGEVSESITLHNGEKNSVAITGAYQKENPDTDIDIERPGTKIKVSDVPVETLIDLENIKKVKQYVKSRFNPVLKRRDIDIYYETNRNKYKLQPFVEENFNLVYEENKIDTEYGVVKDLRIYDKRSDDQDVPFSGIAMMKRNEHENKPFMRVHDYKPVQLNNIDKVFGFCDVTSLCPEYENNAHNSLQGGIVTNLGVKERLEEVLHEQFVDEKVQNKEFNEIVEESVKRFNSHWSKHFTDNPFESSSKEKEIEAPEYDEMESNNKEDEEQDKDEHEEEPNNKIMDPSELLPGKSEDDKNNTPSPPKNDEEDDEEEEQIPEYEISLFVRNREEGSEAAKVRIGHKITNPKERRDIQEFFVELRVRNDNQDVRQTTTIVDTGFSDSGRDIEYEFEEAGEYVIEGTMYTSDGTEDLDDDNVVIKVGEPEEQDFTSETPSMIDDVSQVKNDSDIRYEIQAGTDGLKFILNTKHPRWQTAADRDGKNSNENRVKLMVRWLHQASINKLVADRASQDLTSISSSDEVNEFIEWYSDLTSEKLHKLVTEIYR